VVARDVPLTRRMRGTPMKTTDSVGRQTSLPRPKLRVNEAARHLGLAVSTMNKMRLSGLGPCFIRLTSRRVAYDLDDLEAWAAKRKRNHTSDNSEAPEHAVKSEETDV